MHYQTPFQIHTFQQNRFFCQQGIVYGRAFQVHDSTALSYLKNRECILGGYITTLSTFCTQAGNEDISTIIFIATSKNEQWLGEAPLHTIAAQIYECSGPSGHNVEYLLRYITCDRYAMFPRTCGAGTYL